VKLLSLDFDGVISDSAPESFEVALRTYRALGNRDAFSRWDRVALYRRFVEAMPLGNRAEDFGAALSAIDSGVELLDQHAYDAYRCRLEPEWLRRFHERFYRERSALSQTEPRRWHAMLGPYAPFLNVLRRRAGSCPYAIATAKDRRSVGLLLDAYGVRDLFPDEHVLDKEVGVSKVSHHQRLTAQFGLAPEEITFVDDKVNHLDAVAELGVRCVLAAWGYNGPREHELAHRRGYLVATLEGVESELFGPEGTDR
jgi:phosphoglycolate phosphatase-like HAD superfamily hydrolase